MGQIFKVTLDDNEYCLNLAHVSSVERYKTAGAGGVPPAGTTVVNLSNSTVFLDDKQGAQFMYRWETFVEDGE